MLVEVMCCSISRASSPFFICYYNISAFPQVETLHEVKHNESK